MAVGELVAAHVIDQRVFDAYGESGPDGLYLLGRPGRALPFTIFRAWKVPTGFVNEEVRFIGPSGRTMYRWGPTPRRMVGAMDLTVESDRINDAMFEETGLCVASFILEGEIVGEIEVPVSVQEAPIKLSKDVEDGLKKSDVIWIHDERAEQDTWYEPSSAPVWFAYKNGRIFVLHQRESGPDEQTVPGLPDAHEVEVTTRLKGRDTAALRFPAAIRVLAGPEWDEAAKALADKRKSRHGSPQESIQRWRGSCDIVELTPVID